MPLEGGKQLGPYEIQAPIGAGGMGGVYTARDTRLDQTVTIQVLLEHVVADPVAVASLRVRTFFGAFTRTIARMNPRGNPQNLRPRKARE